MNFFRNKKVRAVYLSEIGGTVAFLFLIILAIFGAFVYLNIGIVELEHVEQTQELSWSPEGNVLVVEKDTLKRRAPIAKVDTFDAFSPDGFIFVYHNGLGSDSTEVCFTQFLYQPRLHIEKCQTVTWKKSLYYSPDRAQERVYFSGHKIVYVFDEAFGLTSQATLVLAILLLLVMGYQVIGILRILISQVRTSSKYTRVIKEINS